MGERRDHMGAAAAAPIAKITRQCLEDFERVEKNHDKHLLDRLVDPSDKAASLKGQQRSSFAFLGLRSKLQRWIDRSGALAPLDLSLDERLSGLRHVSAMVTELLAGISRNLDCIANEPGSDTTSSSGKHDDLWLTWQEASRAIEHALDHLHFISVEIRRSSPQQIEDSLTMSEIEDHIAFRRDMVALVGYRFPAARKRLCRQLGNSIVARRHILLQTQRHARRPATRRSTQTASLPSENKDTDSKSKAAIDQQVQWRHSPRSTTFTGVTEASQSDPQAPALERVQGPSQKALRRVMSNFTTQQHDSSEYPPMPKVIQGQAAVQCPFCFMAWEQTTSEPVNLGLWKLHIDEHIKPYSCLFPRCANSLLFFEHQQQWVDHMESVHSRDWLREAHTKQWYCDFGHKSTLTFELEVQWREHMLEPTSHPEIPEAPSRLQLKALSQERQRIVLRDRFVCLLCERIPEEVQQKLDTGQHDSTEVHNSVVDHVATHLKSLSLLAIPSLREAADETANHDQESVVLTKGSSKRLLNPDSLPYPPTGRKNTTYSASPPSEWPDLKHETIAFNEQEGWDDDFMDYRQPDEPPESPMFGWFEQWHQWKGGNDAVLNQSSSKDPVPHLVGTSETRTSAIDVDFRDDVGRTALSLAAQDGDTEAISRLIILGAGIELDDRDGKTPLCWAAGEGHESAVKFLIDKGARIEATDQIFGRTPLSWAAARGHVSVVRLLCMEGADVDAVDNSQRTPLSWAASRGNEDTLRLLIDASSDIKSTDSRCLRTPLHWAATRNRLDNVRLLLQYGAQIDAIDGSFKTPLSLASEDGYDSVVEVLLNNGADMEACHPVYEQAPLSVASEHGHEDVVRLLLAHGAKVGATDFKGWTARDRAIDQGHDEITKLLETYQGGGGFLCLIDRMFKACSVSYLSQRKD